jgi:hypothetical protein
MSTTDARITANHSWLKMLGIDHGPAFAEKVPEGYTWK